MKKSNNISKIFSALLNDFTRIDRTCNNCGREIFKGKPFFATKEEIDAYEKLQSGEQFFCDECFEKLPRNDGYVCAHCGRSVISPVEFCDECTGIEWSFEMARSPFCYAPPVNEMIKKQKYSGKKYTSEIFAPFLSAYLVKYFLDADVLTFVPMTKKALRKRGYNQAELLCKEISKETGFAYADLLEKTADTEHQAKLNRNERLTNLKNTFKVRNTALVENKRIVLIDDVLTTGATAETVSAALKKAGAAKVYVLTVSSVTDRHTKELEDISKREKSRLSNIAKNSR